jgi:hypothetical protein
MNVPRLAALGLAGLTACVAASPTATPAPAVGGLVIATPPAPPAVPPPAPPPVPAPAAVETVIGGPVDGGTAAAAVTAEAGPPPGDAGRPSACNEQPPQDFLVRGNFLKTPDGRQRAIQYRTDTYGYFPGFGRPSPGAEPPVAQVVTTTFMGLPVRMHRKVVPALQCAEQEIKLACVDHPYTARALAGVRFKNTYRGGEVTNHIYGIAIDIDPAQNTCCGCVKPWSTLPVCRRPAKSEYDRMAMPECWVHAFERFGFYWLGHDVLRDTMHFEFLGDPARILKVAPAPAAGK